MSISILVAPLSSPPTNLKRDFSFAEALVVLGVMLRYQLDIRSFDELSDEEVYDDSD